MMDQLTAWFDWIIIDSPPVMPLADTSVWMRLADGILLVARQGTTEKRQLQRGLEAIEPKKLIGALLNGSKRRTSSDYYYAKVPAIASQPNDKSHRITSPNQSRLFLSRVISKAMYSRIHPSNGTIVNQLFAFCPTAQWMRDKGRES